ncbi:hypothetical protein, partial [Marinobacter sp.]|uniref:hypothetical protein n=1 Tax=Marinobacter sp. TaxID=50741 RepID=UPI002353FF2A
MLLVPAFARPPPAATTIVRLLAASPNVAPETVNVCAAELKTCEPKNETVGFVVELLLLPSKAASSNF